MSIYFIRAGGYFKIGETSDAARRFQRLDRSGTRYTFPAGVSLSIEDRELYRVIPGDLQDERRIHHALDDFAVGLEWFLDEPPLREFVDSLPAAGPTRKLAKVERSGGWCEAEYREVQDGRARREVARHYAKRDRARAS